MKQTQIILMLLRIPVDYGMLLLAGVSAYYLRFSDFIVQYRPVLFRTTLTEFLSIVSWVALGWLVIFAFNGLYSPNPNRKLAKDLMKLVFACSTGLAAIAVFILFRQELFDSRFLVAAGSAFAFVYVALGRILLRAFRIFLYRFGIGLRRVVIIGKDAAANELYDCLTTRPALGYNVVGQFGRFEKKILSQLADLKLDELVFTNPRAHEQEAIAAISYCNEHHIVFKYSADMFAAYMSNVVMYPLAGVPIVEVRRTALGLWGRVVKRFYDVLFSLILIVLTSPIMIGAALIILVRTGRPIVYKSERVGYKKKRFFAYKFRSMYADDCTGSQFGDAGEKAEEKERDLIAKQNSKTGPIYKVQNDPRITPFGRFIRKWSIDELPQFFNVLKGEMSLVGPRPHQPREVEGYTKRHKLVFEIRPGVTGLAQISGRSDLSYEDELRLDVFYIEHWNLFLDAIIFLKTPFILFKKRRAL